MNDIFQFDYFSILDIVFSLLCLVLMLVVVNAKKKGYLEFDYYQYFTGNVFAKVFLSFVYALYYIFIVDGGDTLAYWDGGIKMNNLFSKSASMYFEELFNDPDMMMNGSHFDLTTGYPPGWIYREKESWFIAKIMSIFSFFCFRSYLVATFILAYISSIASWKLFELAYSFRLNSNRYLALACFFVPSVSFWCSGITKDTIVLFSTIFIIYHAFQILSLDKQATYKNYLWIAFYTFLLLHIRDFMIATILVPLAFTYSARLANKYRQNKFAFYFIRFCSIVIGVLFFVFQGSSITNSEKLEEAAIIQKDLANNATYEGARYDLGITDYSAAGMLQAFPVAVIAGLYRPFPWEALSITLILNGLEGALFLYLTFVFFRRNSLKKINLIRKHEFFIFCFFFMVLMAYMAGLTSGLIGVLVRFKAPLIPFFVLLLTIDFEKKVDLEVEAEVEDEDEYEFENEVKVDADQLPPLKEKNDRF
jgi:hypothetical protein